MNNIFRLVEPRTQCEASTSVIWKNTVYFMLTITCLSANFTSDNYSAGQEISTTTETYTFDPAEIILNYTKEENDTQQLLTENLTGIVQFPVKKNDWKYLFHGRMPWYIAVMLTIFIIILITGVNITCYFDLENRRSRLPQTKRPHSMAAELSARADEIRSTQSSESAREGMKHHQMLIAHKSVSERSKKKLAKLRTLTTVGESDNMRETPLKKAVMTPGPNVPVIIHVENTQPDSIKKEADDGPALKKMRQNPLKSKESLVSRVSITDTISIGPSSSKAENGGEYNEKKER